MGIDMSKTQVKVLMKAADLDGDGTLSKEEFIAIARAAQTRSSFSKKQKQ